ncbi:MAG: nucleotidyltransferase substrate binding protein [Ignavibacteriae bacterium]|nr:nucleotidyltransferase substrate binding protein [Ignavibacteriota bacterium]
MEKDIKALLLVSLEKVKKSIDSTLEAIKSVSGFDPMKKNTLKEEEPYDALTMRFTRAVEVCLKFFRTYELYTSRVASDTIRDRLLNMEKFDFISNTELWLDMRDVRNRVVHDYLPDEVKKTFDLIINEYAKELDKLKKKVSELKIDEK